jgi:uncharacterized protein YdaU (DUF1376 family)
MAKVPYMPLYVGDYTLGTRTMTSQEKGVYMDLLIEQWDKGFIPSEMKRLKQINYEVEEVWETLKDKFKEVEPGKLQNAKTEEVRDQFLKRKKAAQENGSKGGRPPKTKEEPEEKPNQNLNDNLKKTFHNEDEYESEYEDKIETGKGGVGEKELAVSIADYFKVTEMNNTRNWFRIHRLARDAPTEQLKVQFEAYKAYKEHSKENVHSLNTWMGSEDQNYQDGAWCSCDWSAKMKPKKNGYNREKLLKK